MKKKIADVWDTIKTKAVLFRIWFFKNITVFAYIALIVIFTFVVCGALPNDFAILGEMSSIINGLYAVNSVGTAAKWAVSTLSATSIVFVFCTYARRIGMSDITSDRVKLMFIKAGLCFDDKGYLVTRKKYEEEKAAAAAKSTSAAAVSTDTATTESSSSDSTTVADVIASPVKAVQEFVTITSAEVDHDVTLTSEGAEAVNADEATEATDEQVETADALAATKQKHTYERLWTGIKGTLGVWKSSLKELVSKDKTSKKASASPDSPVSVIKSSKSEKVGQKAQQAPKSLNKNQSVTVTLSEKVSELAQKIAPSKKAEASEAAKAKADEKPKTMIDDIKNLY